MVLRQDVGADAVVVLEGAEYPAREFVDTTLARAAARAFFEDGSRLARLPWASPG